MKGIDTCTMCIKKKLCMPGKPYYGWCQWRETKKEQKDDRNILLRTDGGSDQRDR